MIDKNKNKLNSVSNIIYFYFLEYIYAFEKDDFLLNECIENMQIDMMEYLLQYIIREFRDYYESYYDSKNTTLDDSLLIILKYFESKRKLYRTMPNSYKYFLFSHHIDTNIILKQTNLSVSNHKLVLLLLDVYSDMDWHAYVKMCKLYLDCENLKNLNTTNRLILFDTIIHVKHLHGVLMEKYNNDVLHFLNFKSNTTHIWDLFHYAKYWKIPIINSFYITKNIKKITNITYNEYLKQIPYNEYLTKQKTELSYD